MAPPKQFTEQTVFRPRPGILERIRKVLRPKELQADFLRAAVDQLLVKREAKK